MPGELRRFVVALLGESESESERGGRRRGWDRRDDDLDGSGMSDLDLTRWITIL